MSVKDPPTGNPWLWDSSVLRALVSLGPYYSAQRQHQLPRLQPKDVDGREGLWRAVEVVKNKPPQPSTTLYRVVV